MDLARYAELFLTESQEHLQTINEALLELERAGADSASVDRFFRAVHTIKGMSATMGYTAVAQLSHEMESLLSDVRDGSRTVDEALLDSLFQATDALEHAVTECAAGRADALDLATALTALAAVRKTVAPANLDVAAGAGTRSMTPDGEAAPTDALRVEIRIRSDAPLPGVRALLVIGKLRGAGEVIGVHPSETDIQSEAFDGRLHLFLRTAASPDSVADIAKSVGDIESVAVRSVTEHATHDAEIAATAGEIPAGASQAPGSPAGVAGARATAASSSATKHVRVDQRRLDSLMNLVGELVIARGRLSKRSVELQDAELEEALAGASRQIADLQDEIMASRMVPVWQVFDRFPRLVRDSARALDKKVDFVMEGRDIELDRSLLDEIGEPIVHLLRNAVDHGIEGVAERTKAGKSETGRLTLSASRDREAVLLTVTDDGRGIDREKIARKAREMNLIGADATTLSDEQLFSVISTSGFSTADRVTDISGRGVGVDAVINRVRTLGGSVELRTGLGEGTSVTIRLPLTLAIIKAMLARVGGETYALPLTHVAESVEVDAGAFRTIRGRQVTILREEVLPLTRLREVVQLPRVPDAGCQQVVLEVGARRMALIVDELVGQQEVVVKQFDPAKGGVGVFSGATILGNGELALIVDVGSIF